MTERASIKEHLRYRRPVRFLFDDDVQRFKLLAVKCGPCKHATGHRKDQQSAYCGKHRFMVGTTTPLLCDQYELK